MLLSAVSVLVVAQSSSEFPEGLMNNPVYICVCVCVCVCVVGTNIKQYTNKNAPYLHKNNKFSSILSPVLRSTKSLIE